MKTFYILVLIFTSSLLYAKGSSKAMTEIEPYFSGVSGTFKREGIFKGKYLAAGAGARVGMSWGPLFFGGEGNIQTAAFKEDSNRTDDGKNTNPSPNYKPWISWGLSAGIRTRYFSIMYTHFLDSNLKGQVYFENPDGVDAFYEYTFKGGGSKISAMIHFTKNFSIGAEYVQYTYDTYSLPHDTHLLTAGNDQTLSPKLKLSGVGILINYKIPVTLMN